MTESRRLRILLVDDDETLCLGLGWMIRQMGHALRVAYSGRNALKVLEEGPDFDLVLLDLRMPDMGGEETLRRILELRPRQVVVIISGIGDRRVDKVLGDWPQVSFLGKPFTGEDLQRVIEAVVHLYPPEA